ncbi:hypothetical protein B0H10DRAFT_2439236 [Mycena sp. CBHHK59/15]|nr:hypothetical protein B0H10DRAFT_2439236 [Mycena sp. CBHHK59/15]
MFTFQFILDLYKGLLHKPTTEKGQSSNFYKRRGYTAPLSDGRPKDVMASKSSSNKPASNKPVSNKPASNKPVTNKPATNKPASGR